MRHGAAVPQRCPRTGVKGERMLFFWSAWFAAGVILTLILAGGVLPYLWKRAYAALHPPRDRGVSGRNTEEGCSISFETAEPVSPFMCRYVLIRGRGLGQTHFVGEWTNPVAAAEYGLIAYGKNGVPCSVLHIRQFGSICRRFTEPAILPEETEYVSVVYCRTRDGFAQRSERTLHFWIRTCLFFLAAAAAAGILVGCTLRFAEAVACEAFGYTSVLPVGGAVAAVVCCMAGIPLLVGALDLFVRPHAKRALSRLADALRIGRLKERCHKISMRVRMVCRKTAFFLRARFCMLQNIPAGVGAPKPPQEDDAEGGERS